MEPFEALRVPELEVEVEVEREPEHHIERAMTDDLDDAWFTAEPIVDDDLEPIRPLRRLGAWVRDRLAA